MDYLEPFKKEEKKKKKKRWRRGKTGWRFSARFINKGLELKGLISRQTCTHLKMGLHILVIKLEPSFHKIA